MTKPRKKIIAYNSPVILTFTLISFAALIAGILTNGASTEAFFMVYRSSLLNPLFYLRLFTHVLGHADISHFAGNIMLLLLAGPMIEEKYGSFNMAAMIILTAFATGLLNVILFPTVALCGASGVVFMLIILSSFTGMKNQQGIPLTLILVAVVYIGSEIVTGIMTDDNISQFAHILGGIFGGGFGFFLNGFKKKPA